MHARELRERQSLVHVIQFRGGRQLSQTLSHAAKTHTGSARLNEFALFILSYTRMHSEFVAELASLIQGTGKKWPR
jgi:hypothetical protein